MMTDNANEPPPPSLTGVLARLWVGLLRPRLAADFLSRTSLPVLWSVFVLYVGIISVVFVGLVAWDETIVMVRQAPASQAAMTPPVDADQGQQSNDRFWVQWLAGTVWLLGGRTFLGACLVVALIVLMLAAFGMHRVHRDGAIHFAARRSLAAVLALMLWWIPALLLVGTLVVRARQGTQVFRGFIPLELLSPIVTIAIASIGLIVTRISIILARMGAELPAPVLPPRCEGCGYNLSTLELHARCPECGLVVGESLRSVERRPGCVWESGSGVWPKRWFKTTATLLLQPRRFYSGLTLRSGTSKAISFVHATVTMIVVVAAVWIVAFFLLLAYLQIPGPAMDELPYIGMLFSAMAVFGCWLGFRIGAAIVTAHWLWTRALPDMRWAVKVVAYESAFLWVYCAFWALMVMSLAFWNAWVTRSCVVRPFVAWTGVPAEAGAIIVGTLALSGVWLYRYNVARRAIRWSNH